MPLGGFAEAAPTGVTGSVAEVVQDTALFERPDRRSRQYGMLPQGTLLRIIEEPRNRLVPVEVELEQGTLEGWVGQESLNLGGLPAPSAGEPLPAVQSRVNKPLQPRIRRKVPKDEALLLKRAPTFFYGVMAEGLYSVVNAVDGNSFAGMGFGLGGHVGTFVDRDIVARLELGYRLLAGLDLNNIPVDFGFLDVGVLGSYTISGFELMMKLSYAFAMSVSPLPGGLELAFDSLGELGGFWLTTGVGYRFELSPLIHLTVRGNYQFGFNQFPFNFQAIGLGVVVDFQG